MAIKSGLPTVEPLIKDTLINKGHPYIKDTF